MSTKTRQPNKAERALPGKLMDGGTIHYPDEHDRPEESPSPFAMLGAKTLPDRIVEEDKRKG